jgi:hypothetical protein
MTVIQAGREGLVVIALDGQDLSLLQQGEDPIRVWTKGPHISEAKNGLDLSPPNIFQRGLEGEIVVVDPPTDGNPPVLLWFRVHSLLLTVHSSEFMVHRFKTFCWRSGLMICSLSLM